MLLYWRVLHGMLLSTLPSRPSNPLVPVLPSGVLHDPHTLELARSMVLGATHMNPAAAGAGGAGLGERAAHDLYALD